MSSNHQVVDIEKALLGLLLTEKNAIDKTRGYLMPSDFYDPNNKIIYDTILNTVLKDGLVDVKVLINTLKKEKKLRVDDIPDYIAFLIEEAGWISNIDSYIKKIIDASQIRIVEDALNKLNIDIKKTNVDTEDVFNKIEKEIFSTIRNRKIHEFKEAKEIVAKAIKDIEMRATKEGVSGIASGFPSVDEMTAGFQDGDLIIIASRPSMGKTAFALNLAANIANKQYVALFSLEMSSTSLMKRILSFLSFIDGKKIATPRRLSNSEWQKMTIASEKAKKLKLFIDDSPGIKLSEILWKTRRLKKNYDIKLIIIDYLQLINVSSSTENRQNEVSLISRTLKQLARELNIPIIALAQLSRRVEQRENKMPLMSDLRESGAIEQDADLVTFLYREAYYDKTKLKDAIQKTDIIFSKHRNGPVGIVSLSFNPTIGLFTEIIGEEE